MELLVGCGNNRDKKIKVQDTPQEWCELVTMDWDEGVNPHVVHDLCMVPYPFDDDTFDEIHAYEVLEHCGAQGDWRLFFNQFQEFWRILKPGGLFVATCPPWDSIWAWGDPGHSRVISEASLIFLDQDNYESQVGRTAMTDYRRWYKGNFERLLAREQSGTFVFILRAKK